MTVRDDGGSSALGLRELVGVLAGSVADLSALVENTSSPTGPSSLHSSPHSSSPAYPSSSYQVSSSLPSTSLPHPVTVMSGIHLGVGGLCGLEVEWFGGLDSAGG